MAEQEAVNFKVVGSSPTGGANLVYKFFKTSMAKQLQKLSNFVIFQTPNGKVNIDVFFCR